jgi:hypothetical protein
VECPVNLAIAKNTQSVPRDLANNALVDKVLRPDFGSLLELRKITDIDRGEFLFEYRVRKAALRHTPVQRHLAALKPTLLAAP